MLVKGTNIIINNAINKNRLKLIVVDLCITFFKHLKYNSSS